jgi:hypothetical protein
MKKLFFWVVGACGTVAVRRNFGGTYCVHHQSVDRPDNGGSMYL